MKNEMTTLLDSILHNAIGFDEVFRNLDRNTGFPPYNVVEDGNTTKIEMALAGYSRDDIDVSQDGHTLTIGTRKDFESSSGSEESGPVFRHRGIAKRKFESRFALAHNQEVIDASLEHGMLVITVARNTDDSIKRIEIK